jgi:hypothetical protein
MKGFDDSNTFGNFHLPAKFNANRPGRSFFFGIFLKFPDQAKPPGTKSFFSSASDEFFDRPPISVTFRC